MEISYDSEEYLNFLEGCYQNPVVLVEISSVCNFQCVYCVSRLKRREKGFMSQELFEHIVEQLPKITPYPVRLHIDGEPTTHPKFYEYGKILNQAGIPTGPSTGLDSFVVQRFTTKRHPTQSESANRRFGSLSEG